jgi:oxygen-independent coproporphyrinogen-3 oxidase
MNAMNDRWDLSYLYRSFEDEAFRRDLSSLPEEAARLQALLADASLSSLEKLERFQEEEEKLSREAQMEETMFLGLRETEGVAKAEFYRRFGVSMRNVYGKVMDEMATEGLLLETEENVCLSERGLDLANYVMAAFLLD